MNIFVSACNPTSQFIPTEPDNSPPPAPSEAPISPTATSIPITTPSPLATLAIPAPCFITYNAPVAFTPDSRKILVRSNSGVQIFNLHTMQEESFLEAPTNLNGPVVALSPDGETIAWTLEDYSIQWIRLSDKKLLHTLVGHSGMITELEFSPTGDRLYSASHDTWIRIWDINGKQVDAFQPTGADNIPSEVLGMGISPAGTRLASVPLDGPVKIWSLEDDTLLRELGGSGAFDTADVAFSPDERYVAADLTTGFYLWKVADGFVLLGGAPAINTMAFAFSPDGRYLSYSDIDHDNKIILSSPDGISKIMTMEGHQAPVLELIFSPDGSLLASADDQEIRIWQVDTGKLLYIGKTDCP